MSPRVGRAPIKLKQQKRRKRHENNENDENNHKKIKLAEELMDENNSTQLDILIEKIYSKIVDLARKRELKQDIIKATKNIDHDSASLSESINKENHNDVHLEIEDKFELFKHTCPLCVKSYESQKYLRRHFMIEHLLSKPIYEHNGEYFELDDYLIQLISKNKSEPTQLTQLANLYELFIIKSVQDVLIDYYVNPKLQDTKCKTKVEHSFKQRLNSIIISNFIYNESASHCTPIINFTAASLKDSSLSFRISGAELYDEIRQYILNKPIKSNIASVAASKQYICCRFCLKLFDEFKTLRQHLITEHTINNSINKCIVCPYCREVIKSARLTDSLIDLLNEHINKGFCFALRTNMTSTLNTFNILRTQIDSFQTKRETESVAIQCELIPIVGNKDSMEKICKKSLDEAIQQNATNLEAFTAEKMLIDNVIDEEEKKSQTEHLAEEFGNETRSCCYLCDYKLGLSSSPEYESSSSQVNMLNYGSLMKQHLDDKHLIDNCILCKSIDKISSSMQDHFKEVHYNQKLNLFVCDMCNEHKSFDSFMEFKVHLDQVHRTACERDKRWRCFKCCKSIECTHKMLIKHWHDECNSTIVLDRPNMNDEVNTPSELDDSFKSQ
jgi:hypothetical protein